MRHRQHSLISCLAGSLIFAASIPALAQEPPNLIGTWQGTGVGVRVAPDGKSGPNFPDKDIEATIVITEQHGNRFAGQASVDNVKKTVIGAMHADNRGGVMLDDDGQYLFTLTDPNMMDSCYNHYPPASRLIGCFLLRRSR